MFKKLFAITLLCAGFVVSQSSWANYPIVPTISQPTGSSGITSGCTELGGQCKPVGGVNWIGMAPMQSMLLDVTIPIGAAAPKFKVGSLGAFKELSPTHFELTIPAGTSAANVNTMIHQLVLVPEGCATHTYFRAELTYSGAPAYFSLWQGMGTGDFPP